MISSGSSSSQEIIIIIDDDAELALEIQREIEQDIEDQFVLQQMIVELDDDGYGNNKQEKDWRSGDKKA
jgi:hypothetical protein